MRERFLLKGGPIALLNCPVILRYFLVWVSPDSTGTSGPTSTSGPISGSTSATSQSATEATSTTDSTDAPVNFSTEVNAEPIPASEQAEDDFRSWLRSYDDYMKLFLSFATPGITVTTTSGTTNKGNQNYLTNNKCQKFGKLLHYNFSQLARLRSFCFERY